MDQMKEQLLHEMREVFGEDSRRVEHALAVTAHAEEILQHEEADERIVLPAAILHDIGIHEAERKYDSSAGKYQEIEGPPIARRILEKLHSPETKIEAICEIVGNHHTPGNVSSPEFAIINDADWLVNLPDEYPGEKAEKLTQLINKLFQTDTGKRIARDKYLRTSTSSIQERSQE